MQLAADVTKSESRHWYARDDSQTVDQAERERAEPCVVVCLELLTSDTRHAEPVDRSGLRAPAVCKSRGQRGERGAETVTGDEKRLARAFAFFDCLFDFRLDRIEGSLEPGMRIRFRRRQEVHVRCQRLPHRRVGSRECEHDRVRPLADDAAGIEARGDANLVPDEGLYRLEPHSSPTVVIVSGLPVSYASCDIHISARALPIVKPVAPGSNPPNALGS